MSKFPHALARCLALIALIAASMLPAFAQMRSGGNQSFSISYCSSTSTRAIAIVIPGKQQDDHTVDHFGQCPFCAAHTHLDGLPPARSAWIPPEVLDHLTPEVSVLPLPLDAVRYRLPASRAPPALI
ncbi:DUF2946 domain-containing protein [Burkholderiaceae bacterium DAT-1]|nr:DUF2946 domain-containing protein [Burkholderiaceae bacterium DAT-1]